MSRASTGPVRRADRGFSLIELLVVIAVISILIGILLPALPAVIANARRTACAANLRGLGQGLELYKGDSNEVYPDARYMPEPWLTNFDGESQLGLPELPTFPEALADQIDRYSEAYRCPGDKTIATTTYVDDDGVERESAVSYTYIVSLGGGTFEDSFFATRLGRSPTETPVLHDFDGGTYETEDGRQVVADFFHQKRNLLFVDGHVGEYQARAVPLGSRQRRESSGS